MNTCNAKRIAIKPTKEIHMSYDLTLDTFGDIQLIETTEDVAMEMLIESFTFEIH